VLKVDRMLKFDFTILYWTEEQDFEYSAQYWVQSFLKAASSSEQYYEFEFVL